MLIIKGIIIGIGKIIPGVSGSMLAISLGIYQKLINSINNIFKNPKENLTFLTKVSIGIIISIVFFSKIIINCLNNHYLITIFFFIGLILGSFNDIKGNIVKKNNYITIITCIVIVILGFINIDNEINIQNRVLNFIYFIFIGFIDALTTIIPGISGTATLMMLGGYTKVINMFSTMFDLNYFINNIFIFIPFIIGFIIGIVFTAKLVSYLFKHYKSKTYNVILGFSVATVILMLIKSFNNSFTVNNLIIGVCFLIIGIFITKKINQLFMVD